MTRRIRLAALLLLAFPLTLHAQQPARRTGRPPTAPARRVCYDFATESPVAGLPGCPNAPPNWNPSMPRAGGLPRFTLDSTAYRGWLPLDSMRSLYGGFVGRLPWDMCSDSLGQFSGADALALARGDVALAMNNPCKTQMYLMAGHPGPDGAFFGYMLTLGSPPFQTMRDGPPDGPWRWGMTFQRIRTGPRVGALALPVEGHITAQGIEWVVRWSARESSRFWSTRAHEDGRVEGLGGPMSATPFGDGSRAWTFYRMRGEPLIPPREAPDRGSK